MSYQNFAFDFKVSSEILKSVKPLESHAIPDDFVTIVQGLALIWRVKIYPNGIKFGNREEPNHGIGGNGDEKKRTMNEADYLISGYGEVLPDLPITEIETGFLKGIIHLCIKPLSLNDFVSKSQRETPPRRGLLHLVFSGKVEKRAEEWANVSIQCSDGEVKTSRYMLAVTSPYYAALFDHNANNGLPIEKVCHQAFSVTVVTEFLRCLYAGIAAVTLNDLSTKEKMDLMKLADQVGADVSTDIVREPHSGLTLYLDAHGFTGIEEAIEILLFANLHSLHLLQNLALAYLSTRLADIPVSLLPRADAKDDCLSPEIWKELGELNKSCLRVSQVKEMVNFAN